MKTIKERWNEEDERCSYCNNVTKKVIGLNKQNLKRLFTKPTLQDIIVFIMLLGCLILTWAYYADISQYQAIIKNPIEFCTIYQNQIFSEITMDNISNLNLQFNENGN